MIYQLMFHPPWKKFSSTENINKNQISVIMDSIISILNNFETLKKMHIASIANTFFGFSKQHPIIMTAYEFIKKD